MCESRRSLVGVPPKKSPLLGQKTLATKKGPEGPSLPSLTLTLINPNFLCF